MKKIIKQLKEDWQWWNYSCGYAYCCEEKSDTIMNRALDFVQGLWFILVWQWVIQIPCFIFGHKIEVESWGGPDSGGEEWECVRCHTNGHHTYY